jgi:hypothetical protein
VPTRPVCGGCQPGDPVGANRPDQNRPCQASGRSAAIWRPACTFPRQRDRHLQHFKFFVWTIVGVFTFLFLVVFSDPANITDLPKIPDEFLALKGISSFGYLGGKLARKPGPIIDEIAASAGSLIVEIRGRKLSRTAGLKIDGADVRITDTILTGADGQSPDYSRR